MIETDEGPRPSISTGEVNKSLLERRIFNYWDDTALYCKMC